MIPHILHAIWLGGKPMPEENQRNLDRWAELHPGWKSCTWRGETEIIERLLDAKEYSLAYWFRNLPVDSLAAISDVARLLILKILGGVYIDGDMEPVRNITPLLASTAAMGNDCFVGWEQNLTRINNAVIGAEKDAGPIADALDALKVHLEDPNTKLRNAAHATGPFFLNGIWKDDERVTKFTRETFYPYDWHEPWRASEKPGPDTYAIHRWDASWVDEIEPPAKQTREPLGIVMVGVGQKGDEGKMALAWGSHFYQSLHSVSRAYSGVWDMCLRADLHRYISRLRDASRVLFVPWDHVLDRNTCETHLALPNDTIGATRSRLFSSNKLFPVDHRRAKAFPFDIFSAHGYEPQPAPRIRNTYADVWEVFSAPIDVVLTVLRHPPDMELLLDPEKTKTWPQFAQRLVAFCQCRGHRVGFTYKTRTTKLCPHPVMEKTSEKD